MKKYFIFLFILTGCGLNEPLTTRIKLDIDALSGEKGINTQSRTETSELPPESISSFDCFFVNIVGSGIRNYDPAQIQKVNSACLGFESISSITDKASMKTNGVSLTMPRSASASHTVNVYGVAGLPSGLSCGEGLKQTTTRPRIFLVARGTTGPLTSDMTLPVSVVYNKDSSADENLKCQSEVTTIPPAAIFSRLFSGANATYNLLYASGTVTTVPSPAPLFDTAAIVNPPEDFSTATLRKLSLNNNEITDTRDLSPANYNLMGLDLLFDVTNIDVNRVKTITLTTDASVVCKIGTATVDCHNYNTDLNRLVVITPSQSIASSWDCSTSVKDSTTMNHTFVCTANTALTAAQFSRYAFSRKVYYTTTTGTTAEVTRNFIHSTFRAFGYSISAGVTLQMTFTLSNPRLTFGF